MEASFYYRHSNVKSTAGAFWCSLCSVTPHRNMFYSKNVYTFLFLQALKLCIGIGEELQVATIQSTLLSNVSDENKIKLGSFIKNLFNVYMDLHFTYLEVNPLVVKEDGIYVLDLAAKIDQTAEYLCSRQWGEIVFPPPFGREAYPEVSSKHFLFNFCTNYLCTYICILF